MKKNTSKASVEERIIDRLTEFTEHLRTAKRISDGYVCRRLVLGATFKPYGPAMVKKTRRILGASQAVFALFLGVSVKTIRAWEQGINPPNKIACRFMDEIRTNRDLYKRRLQELAIAE